MNTPVFVQLRCRPGTTYGVAEEIARRDFGRELDRTARVQRAILEAGIAHETQAVQWCRGALAALDA